MPKFKIRPVEGRQLLDPRTIGGAQRRIGYRREDGGTVDVLGVPTPRTRFVFDGGEFTVDDTADRYFHRAILDGDVEYVATVQADGTETIDLPLAAANARALPTD